MWGRYEEYINGASTSIKLPPFAYTHTHTKSTYDTCEAPVANLQYTKAGASPHLLTPGPRGHHLQLNIDTHCQSTSQHARARTYINTLVHNETSFRTFSCRLLILGLRSLGNGSVSWNPQVYADAESCCVLESWEYFTGGLPGIVSTVLM